MDEMMDLDQGFGREWSFLMARAMHDSWKLLLAAEIWEIDQRKILRQDLSFTVTI